MKQQQSLFLQTHLRDLKHLRNAYMKASSNGSKLAVKIVNLILAGKLNNDKSNVGPNLALFFDNYQNIFENAAFRAQNSLVHQLLDIIKILVFSY
jgi:hypothetical protein